MKPASRHRSKPRFDPSTILLLKQIGLGLLVLSTVGVLIALVWWGTRIESATLKDISVEGGLTISHDNVRAKVEAELEGTYLGLIPRRFAYFYPELDVAEAVATVPRIKNIAIYRQSGTALRVVFDEYVPEALWCNAATSSPCLFLDEVGFAFAPAPELQGGSMVRYYATEREPKEAEAPFSSADFAATTRFIDLVETLGWYVTKVEVNQTRDVFYTLAQGGELKATLTDAPERPFENLRTILNSEEFKHLKPGGFQYLDLRFGTRVFVNEELPSAEATSTATSTASSTAVAE